MPSTRELHPDVVRRISAIVSGPHACPDCAGPTWTTPPSPWPQLREFVTECSMCRRPLQVRVHPDRVLRGVAEDDAPALDPVTSLLDTPGTRSFARRVAFATLPLLACLVLVGWLLGSWPVAFGIAALLVIPSAMWAPSACASAGAAAREATGHGVRTGSRAVEITRAPWRQLDRERFLHRSEQLDEWAATG